MINVSQQKKGLPFLYAFKDSREFRAALGLLNNSTIEEKIKLGQKLCDELSGAKGERVPFHLRESLPSAVDSLQFRNESFLEDGHEISLDKLERAEKLFDMAYLDVVQAMR